MKALELSLGGKTFMAGEYLALTGGPALVLSTDPRFKMIIRPSSNTILNPFHSQSPAGQFWNLHSDFFSQYEIQFQDPYLIGGFGASSAQFAMLHAFWQVKDSAFTESERFYDWHLMLSDYRSLPALGMRPSGADVIGAVKGGITWFDRSNGKLQRFGWPFQEIQFFVAHTGQKLATHEHLKDVSDFETATFHKAMQSIHLGLSQVDFNLVLDGLKLYREELQNQKRVAQHTLEKVRILESQSSVIFAKGCGAMGSDVILVFCAKENSSSVRALLEKENLKVIADSSKISSGLEIRTMDTTSQDLSL